MSSVSYLKIPEPLRNTFFFSNQEILWDDHNHTSFNCSHPFVYEVAFYSGIKSILPWEDIDSYIPMVFKEWHSLKGALEELFSRRESKATKEPMIKAISLFIEILFWTNHQPVELSPKIKIEELQIKPVNIEERLNFVITRPTLYHSYMQLCELMLEIEKQYVKNKIVKSKK